MIGIMIMMNNYFHDFATALMVVCSYAMVVMVRYAEAKGGLEMKGMVVGIYPKMLHINVGSVIFLVIAGIVRAFTYSTFEWSDAVGNNQVPALIVKHILLFALFFYGVYMWVIVHKKVQTIRNELGNSRK